MSRAENKKIKKSLGAFKLSQFYHLEKKVGERQGSLRSFLILSADLAARVNVGSLVKETDTFMSFADQLVSHFRALYVERLRTDKAKFFGIRIKSSQRYDTQRLLIALRVYRERMRDQRVEGLEEQERRAKEKVDFVG